MGALKFSHAPESMRLLTEDFIANIPEFRHLDAKRVHIIFSNSRTKRALALCHAFSQRLRFVLNMEPHYVIELIERRWQKLSVRDRAKVLIHELYHIPRTFSGNLRNHNDCGFCTSFTGHSIEDSLLDNYAKKHLRMPEADAWSFIERSLQ